jgi:acyl-CoA thioester hydrolase
MGVASNVAYLSWLEVGRVEYLRAAGHDYRRVHESGLDLVVTEAAVRYLVPLRFDDAFEVVCRCQDLRPASFAFVYDLTAGDVLHARGRTRHACVDRTQMRPVRIPDWLREVVVRVSS